MTSAVLAPLRSMIALTTIVEPWISDKTWSSGIAALVRPSRTPRARLRRRRKRLRQRQRSLHFVENHHVRKRAADVNRDSQIFTPQIVVPPTRRFKTFQPFKSFKPSENSV